MGAWVLLLVGLLGAEPAAAQEVEELATVRFDYSRFSDGPRAVPRARGQSLARAERLGLGTRDAASRLLRSPPLPSWTGAVPGAPTESLLWPVAGGHFGRGFGFVRRTRPELRHNGVDIIAPEGSEVRAVADGIVAYSDNGIRGFGNCVLIVHANGWVSLYGHNARTTVQPGWRVERGERIAFVGHTGIAHGPHVHFELRIDGRVVNPMPYMDAVPRRRGRPAAVPPPPPRAPDSDAAGVPDELRAVLDGRATDADRERAGRLFRNLLWPVRGGRLGLTFQGESHRAIEIETGESTAVRAAADGVVVAAGETIPGLGRSIVLLHRNGWITVYGQIAELHVETGDAVLRGAWIARAGATLHFELRDGGALADPLPHLVQAPPDALPPAP